MACKGDVRICPDDEREYACFAQHRRASSWISRDATVRKIYHDTGAWGAVELPRCNADGAMCTVHNMRLERALALGWHPSTDGKFATLRDPSQGLMECNVEWRGRTHADPVERDAYVPPSVHKAVRAALELGSIRYVMRECVVKEATAWNYLATGSALMPGVDRLRDMMPDLADAYDALDDKTGRLTDVVARLPTAFADAPFVMNKVRILRCLHDRHEAPSPDAVDEEGVSRDDAS